MEPTTSSFEVRCLMTAATGRGPESQTACIATRAACEARAPLSHCSTGSGAGNWPVRALRYYRRFLCSQIPAGAGSIPADPRDTRHNRQERIGVHKF